GLREPERVARAWPHELSGGMRQRALIAGAFVAGPRLIVADEPTSALDATVQRRILDHLTGLVRDQDAAMLLITHDLAVAVERADRIVVMREGRIVEVLERGDPAVPASASTVLPPAVDPYVHELLDAVPSPARARPRPPRPDRGRILEVRDLAKRYPDGTLALDGVSFELDRGTTTALVGESGSGKTTVARAVLGLVSPSAGTVRFDGLDVASLRGEGLRRMRRRLQLVQQNPHSSFDPRLPIGRAVAEPLDAFGVGDRAARRRRVTELFDQVALPRVLGDRMPRELSGGQLQRAAIARALALQPELIVCDEPVSALDVSVQAQILDLLRELQQRLGLSFLFITHDLGVVAEIADEIVVLARGRAVEHGPVQDVFARPQDAVTRELLAAAPALHGPTATFVPSAGGRRQAAGPGKDGAR
ncbi:MAG: ATP-binding cassette domain-containing protein, partial [Microbacterium sp.]